MKIKKIITILLVSGVCSLAFADDTTSGDEPDSAYQEFKEVAATAVVGAPWKAKRQKELLKKVNDSNSMIDNATELSYPVSEDQLRQLYGDKATLPFFAYSSLIDKESPAAKAISAQSVATSQPAVAFGIQRVFNRMLPADVAKNWGDLKKPNNVAILNIFDREDAVTNGVILDLPIADLLTLTKREVGYSLVPVLAMRWNDAIDETKQPELFVAYTFMAPDYEGTGEQYTSDQINPIPGYVKFLQKGLKAYGEDFEAMWWATTFLADEETPITEVVYSDIDLATDQPVNTAITHPAATQPAAKTVPQPVRPVRPEPVAPISNPPK